MANLASIKPSCMAPLDEEDLAEAQRLNLKLAKAPRFSIRNRFTPIVIQTLLLLSQVGSSRAVRKAGLSVETRSVEDGGQKVRVRVLRPVGPVRGIVLDYHGGGWVIGNACMNDAANIAIVQACGVAVVSVEYRLAGKAPILTIMDDCLTAALWLLKGGLPEYHDLPVIVVGESAGGHLAAATLLQLKQWPELLGRIVGTILYYGVYDLTGTQSVRQAGPETRGNARDLLAYDMLYAE